MYRIRCWTRILLRALNVAVLLLFFAIPSSCQIPHQFYSMLEKRTPGTVIGDVIKSANLRQRYSADETIEFTLQPPTKSSTPNFAEYFVLEPYTGLLKVARLLDRDKLAPNAETFVIILQAALRRPDFFPFRISITINDTNDHAPVFNPNHMKLDVSNCLL